MIVSLTISNTHERGFAFAVTDEGDQVFIPPHVADGHNLARGLMNVPAQVVTNPNEQQRSNTRWVAVLLHPEAAQPAQPAKVEEPQATRSPEELDREVLSLIQHDGVVTTAIIADAIGTDSKTAGNSASRLFNAGQIAKADVYARCGLQRPNFIMWGATASDFLEAD